MRLTSPYLTAVSALGLLLLPAAGQADLITFGSGSLDRLDLAGPQTEGFFTYTAVGDGWEIQNVLGNPPSALATFFNVQGAETNDTVTITNAGGAVFTFNSVDTRTFGAPSGDQVTISGFLGNALVGSVALTTASTTLQTVNSSFTGPIDRLEVRVTLGGQFSARVLDNFNLSRATTPNPVPEPSEWLAMGMAGTSVMGLMVRARRRKAVKSSTTAA